MNVKRQLQPDRGPWTRGELESFFGQVWNTAELTAAFTLDGYVAPYAVVTRRFDNRRGMMEFQDAPRLYFRFRAYQP